MQTKRESNAKRVLFLVVDGMNDLPIAELKGSTPLEIAKTFAMDFLASRGDCGLLKLFDFGPESDEAMLALLGLKPELLYPGRGILEAYGSGLAIENNAIYFRCNLVKVKGRRILDFEFKPDEKLKKKIEKIISKIKLGINFKFKFVKGHRAILIFRERELGDKVTNTNPAYELCGINKLSKALPRPKNRAFFIKPAEALDESSLLTAKKLNEFSEKALLALKHAGLELGIVARGASKKGKWFDKLKRIKKFRGWALISEMPVEIAIGKLLGMKIYDYTNNYNLLAEKVAKLLSKHNVYLQIKGPDAYGHRGDYRGKAACIEEIDRLFLLPLLEKLAGKKIKLILTCDHITSSKHLSHYPGPLTWIKCDLARIRKEELEELVSLSQISSKSYKSKLKFSEKSCEKKKIIKASQLLN